MLIDNLKYEKKVKVFAFVGPSGTGKSYRAQWALQKRHQLK